MSGLSILLGTVMVLRTAFVPESSAPDIREGFRPGVGWQPTFRPANILAQRVDFDGFNDPKLTLYDALDPLARRYGLTIDVDEKAFQQAGCPNVLEERVALTPIPPMQDVPLSTVIRAILARVPSTSGATVIFRPDLMEITTHRQAAIEGWKGVRDLLSDVGEQTRLLGARLKYDFLEGEDLNWRAIGDYPDRFREMARSLGALNYWRGVMNENARAAAAKAAGRSPGDGRSP